MRDTFNSSHDADLPAAESTSTSTSPGYEEISRYLAHVHVLATGLIFHMHRTDIARKAREEELRRRSETASRSTSNSRRSTARCQIGSVLTQVQRASRMTMEELATSIRVSPAEASSFLSGEQFPSWPVTERLALACGADTQVLRMVWDDEQDRREGGR
ncbi:helix-turn-helix domain-containing protein [Streptomyces niveus]|uniref:helix-turn-helix domain-containing protein n=1 Tax=Streptomyces niveus TaxID=193462 RepID=UPI00344EAA19